MANIVITITRFMYNNRIHSCESLARNNGFQNHRFGNQKVSGSYEVLAKQLARAGKEKIKVTDTIRFIYEQEVFSVQYGKEGKHLVHNPLTAEEVQLFVEAYEAERWKWRWIKSFLVFL